MQQNALAAPRLLQLLKHSKQGSICTEVGTALQVTGPGRAGVMSCSVSPPFGCCLLMQTVHLGLLCVKCQVNSLAYLLILLAALLGAFREGAR